MRSAAHGSTIVRAPNHLGDLVMALPALELVPQADVQVARWLVPVMEMARSGSREDGERAILPLDRGWKGTRAAAAELRGRRYERGILLTPSMSSALIFAFGRVRSRRGTPTDGRRALLTESVLLPPPGTVHRAATFVALVIDELPPEPPVPRLEPPESAVERWTELVNGSDAPVVGVFPGSHASSRRWDAERYSALVRALGERGIRVAVFGSPAERELTALVAGSSGLDLGGRTDLPMLAAGLNGCELLVTNDSGPMHLAAAVGTRTVSLQGPADPRATRPLGSGHRMVWGAPLPCVPCVKNECPRSGSGYVLPRAEKECLRSIPVEAVEEIVLSELSRNFT